jgi:hypothetical protein
LTYTQAKQMLGIGRRHGQRLIIEPVCPNSTATIGYVRDDAPDQPLNL